jgi:AraC-like DNA-binding protein
MKEVMASKRPYMKDSMMTLCSSLVYEVAGSWQNRLSEKELSSPDANNRPKELYDRFIKLVSKHHLQERGVQFYADSLCISPKYLAKVVKTVSGKTATYWIDSYVILEAQNLLRYSDDTIKQIVYKLNFSNQSVFYKFFKAHTGHTPSEYRKK